MQAAPSTATAAPRSPAPAERLTPHAVFLVGALFHYLGPAFAVLLFHEIQPPAVGALAKEEAKLHRSRSQLGRFAIHTTAIATSPL